MVDKNRSMVAISKYARFQLLLFSILMYFLGGGAARFLGETIEVPRFFLGMAFCVLVLFSSGLVKGYYDSHEEFRQVTGEERSNLLTRQALLQAGLVSMGAATILIAVMIINRQIELLSAVLMLLLFVLGYFYSVPPVRLVQRGYGELLVAFSLANLIPAIAYTMQSGDLHRLLGMVTFPLTFILLAYQLANSLLPYASDLKNNKKTMMIVLGWQQGMNLHNLLVLGAYFTLGLAAIFGLPWSLTWPVLLTLPVGLFEIWQMIRIANGVKPAWRLMTFTSTMLVVLTAYLLTYTLWIG
jgi:1,4-dihydroxy-2-naphthoate octaprenyltransferase